MDRFLEYAATVDPAFLSRIEGASPDEIDRLEAIVGAPLPRDYRRFLELMGRRDGGIVAGDDVDTAAADVIRFYEKHDAPEGCIVFAVGEGGPVENACLAREEPHRVFELGDRAPGPLWAASLEGLLCHQLFFRAAARRHAHTTVIVTGDRTPRLELAARFVRTLDLQELWFSDEVAACYESERESVGIHQIPDRGLFVRISTDRSVERLQFLIDGITAAVGVPMKVSRPTSAAPASDRATTPTAPAPGGSAPRSRP